MGLISIEGLPYALLVVGSGDDMQTGHSVPALRVQRGEAGGDCLDLHSHPLSPFRCVF